MRARLVISGANGTIGARLVHDLADLSPDVGILGLFRSEQSWDGLIERLRPDIAARLSARIADVTRADMLDILRQEIATDLPVIGVHCAADVAWDKPFEEMRALNVEGALNFCRLIASASPRARIIYLSTAYTQTHDWTYRNGYEETKALAERLIRHEFAGVPICVFSCSLVVGDSRTGEISRYNGLYPLMRFLTVAGPPFLVGDKDGRLDIVPIDWVVAQLKCLILEQLAGEPPRDMVAAAGKQRIRFSDAVRLIEDRKNRFRETAALPPTDAVPILRVRQWEFLRRALKAWQPPSLPATEFRYFERLLQTYRAYTESDRVREPFGIMTPAPDPYVFLPIVVDHWLEDNATALLAHVKRLDKRTVERRHG